jgi:hypothetical protein
MKKWKSGDITFLSFWRVCVRYRPSGSWTLPSGGETHHTMFASVGKVRVDIRFKGWELDR